VEKLQNRFATVTPNVPAEKFTQCSNFGARHLCRFTVQSNCGVEAG
jgi:hypothetical protein